jgi:hypothetical protein
MASHYFEVGQPVRLKTGRTRPGSKDVYKITAVLPVLGTLPQYRIRSETERHERVTTEDQLVAIPQEPGEIAEIAEIAPAQSVSTNKGENSMAKGQQRKTKEVRKPKKDAKAAKVETGFSVQMKRAESSMTKPGKK